MCNWTLSCTLEAVGRAAGIKLGVRAGMLQPGAQGLAQVASLRFAAACSSSSSSLQAHPMADQEQAPQEPQPLVAAQDDRRLLPPEELPLVDPAGACMRQAGSWIQQAVAVRVRN
jgi:hypothetical protein